MRQVVGCSGFAGIKMHTAGLAMIAGVPALLCAYRDKCRDFAAPIGLEHALFDLPVDEAVALALVEDMLSRPADYTAVPKIAEFADSQRAAAAKVYGG
jgi:polysaccharide pyruvyl transferase WcaK-like protein